MVPFVWLRPSVLKGETGATGATDPEANSFSAGHRANAATVGPFLGKKEVAD